METTRLDRVGGITDVSWALRATVDFAPVGIAQFDTTGRFLLVNQQLCSIFGRTREELAGCTFQELTFPEDLPGCLRLTEELAAGRIPRYRDEKRFFRNDGSVVWVCVTVSAVRDASDAVSFFVGIAEDLTQQRANDERRRAAEERLEAALAASITGTFRWDIVTGELWWDRNLYRLMGREPQEGMLSVEASMEAVHPEDVEALRTAVAHCGAHGGSFNQQFRIVRPNGEVRCLRCLGNTLWGADGKPSHMTGAVTDITDAWTSARMRDEMVAVVAHDLRNPLQSIGMGAGLLMQAGLPHEKRATVTQMIARTVRSMQRLLDDLLDVSRMDAGTFVVSRSPIDPAGFLEEVREFFHAKAAERGLILRCRTAGAAPPINGDRERLLQVMSNLVGNAIKFSDGPGEIRLEAEPAVAGVCISVCDSGRGIRAEDMPHLFDRFWQRDPHGASGVGLGLAICKGIVEAHGGCIWAESGPCGATFRFTLPA